METGGGAVTCGEGGGAVGTWAQETTKAIPAVTNTRRMLAFSGSIDSSLAAPEPRGSISPACARSRYSGKANIHESMRVTSRSGGLRVSQIAMSITRQARQALHGAPICLPTPGSRQQIQTRADELYARAGCDTEYAKSCPIPSAPALYDVHIVGMSPQAFSLTSFERVDVAE